jgi:hypothetical protein
MVTPKKPDVQSQAQAEYLIFDSGSTESDDTDSPLLSSIGKFQGYCVKAAVTAIRGFNTLGFATKVYAKPQGFEATDGYGVRVEFHVYGKHAQGKTGASIDALYRMAASKPGGISN